MTIMNNADLMTIEEASQYLRINRITLYRMVQSGKIPAFKVGRQWRLKRKKIDSWIESQAHRPKKG